MLTILTGKALTWASAIWDRFLSMLKRVFDYAQEGTYDRLMSLSQGRQRVVEFALEFRTLAAKSRWNEPAL